ncbi:MAG: CotH kinase family protein [Oscillospiraceae bacterium]|nr:CotH kinase family protein [Oscillospiraceae bacterium]
MSEKAVKGVLLALMWVAAVVGAFAAISIPVSVAPTVPEPLVAPMSVRFSHAAGFYDEDFTLTLTSNHENAVFYYTTDGRPPRIPGSGSENCEFTKRTDGAIKAEVLPAHPRQLRLHVLSINAVAVAVDENQQVQISQIFTRNFVMSSRVWQRFSENTLIFALNSDPHGLYDHHDGIFVPGIDRELYIAESGRRNPDPPAPANYNRRGAEAEREVYVEVFNSAGEMLLSQNAGMRVRGGWSRASTQKSLELYARNRYSPGTNIFAFDFFGGRSLDEWGEPITEFRRVRLRNNGNDREFGNVRDELGHMLFAQAGFPDTQQHTPAAIFLNGELYGFSWLKTPRTEDHWQRRYGGRVAGFEHIGDGEGEDRTEAEHFSGNDRATMDWLEVVNLARGGFTGSAGERRWSEFKERVCIDNLILYYALQIYISNVDWPGGNIEMWRYFPDADEDLSELHPFLADGKWRFIAQDVEFAWNLYGRGMMNRNTLADVLNGTGEMGAKSELLGAILEREEMKAKFADVMFELMDTVFLPANVNAVLDELIELNFDEISWALSAGLYEPHNPHWPSEGSMRESQTHIRNFARGRPERMVRILEETLGITR